MEDPVSKHEKKGSELRVEDFLLPEKDTIEDVPLPSGMLVTFKRPGLAFHIALGSVPGRVAKAVLAARNGEITEEEARAVDPDPDESERRAEIAVVHCLVKPKFSFEPKPGEYNVRRMQPLDKLRVYRWAMECGGGGVDLESFREKPSGRVPADGASSKADGPAAKQLPEGSGVGV
jgi:hypothetical protein